MKDEFIMDEDYKSHLVHHWAISLITIPNVRKAGDRYAIVTNLRSKRIKFLDCNRAVKSTDNKNSFKYL